MSILVNQEVLRLSYLNETGRNKPTSCTPMYYKEGACEKVYVEWLEEKVTEQLEKSKTNVIT